MRIALCCNDTRGGVEPYAILGSELKRQGHDVVLIAPVDFAGYAERFQLRFAGLSGSQSEVAQIAASHSDKGALAAAAVMLREMPGRVGNWAREMLEGAEGADLLVGGIGGMITGVPVAEKLGRPFLEAHLQPIGVKSRTMNGLLLGSLPEWIGPYGRLLSQQLSELALNLQFGPAMRMARRAISAPSGELRASLPRIFGFSKHVVPDAERFGVPTGYWQAPLREWTPPPELAHFLETERPLVVIGFGSIASEDPNAIPAMAADLCQQLGCKVIYLSGWTAGPDGEAGPDVLHLREAPHAWLFPRVDAVVHHGGAGTTGAAFLAGVPQIVVPTGVDQPFWASRVAALGVGLAAPYRRHLTGHSLGAYVRRVLEGEFRTNAKRIAQLMSSESGVALAGSIIAGRSTIATQAN